MNLLNFPLTKIFAFFIPGIVFAHLTEFDPLLILCISVAMTLCLAAVNMITSPNRLLFSIIIYVTAFLAGMATVTIHREANYSSHFSRHLKPQPQLFEIIIREKLKSTAFGSRYIAVVRNIDGKSVFGKIMVNAGRHADYYTGMPLTVGAAAAKHQRPLNPDQFDYGKYLRNKSIEAQLYVSDQNILGTGKPTKNLYYYSDQIRRRIIANIRAAGMSDRELHVVAALILGQQQEIAADIIEDYRLAGAVHILSVSGLHVGFIILMIDFVLKPLPNTRRWRLAKFLLTILSLWCFAFLAGMSPSVIRSAAMFSILCCGRFMKRGSNIFHTLIVSAILILLAEPMFLFDVGFQLSYSALFFILWLQPELDKMWSPDNKIMQYFWTIFTVSVAAQIGTFPLSVYYFHQFPGLFFITNLVIIPFLTLIMILGVTAMVLAALNLLPAFLADTLEFLIYIMNAVIGAISDYESFIFKDIPMSDSMLASLYIALTAVILIIKRPSYNRALMALGCIIIAQICYLQIIFETQSSSELIVFQRKKQSIISIRSGLQLSVYSTEEKPKSAIDYSIANFCKNVAFDSLPDLMMFREKRILIVDTLLPATITSDILVLRNSPKINMERWISESSPRWIVADGSNFKSYIERWRKTCEKRKIPFHYTGEKGYFKLKG